ncbi:MAG: glycine--tRNA ligase subunit beta, partial [Pseudomonadota bacterium]
AVDVTGAGDEMGGIHQRADLGLAVLALAGETTSRLGEAQLGHGDVEAFATPRRLAVRIRALAAKQPALDEEFRGPPTRVAFDGDGLPTRAATAFAERHGVTVDALDTVATDKGEWLVLKRRSPGAEAATLLPDIVAGALAALPVERPMRWGAGSDEFARPVHWIVALLGRDIVDMTLFGQAAGRNTCGHRFHAPEALALAGPDDYETVLLERGFVIADFDRRRRRVAEAVAAAAATLHGRVEPDERLLDEVTALVEWPAAVTGDFNPEYLTLPREVLISTLKKHQRYFPVEHADKSLLPHFVAVANIDSSDPALVARGNEKVIAPRLADARFFYDKDLSRPLEERLERLKTIIYEKALGSVYDKSARVAELTATVAKAVAAGEDDAGAAARAATLARCDLVTAMVGEFPDLQGVMGGHYAAAGGAAPAISTAIAHFYKPAFAGDDIAPAGVARIVVIADRADTLAGAFATGNRPKGNRDPLGLRRAALGLARTLLEGRLDLDLHALLAAAVAIQPVDTDAAIAGEVYDFVLERLRAYFQGQNGEFDNALFDAVAERRPASLHDFAARLAAVAGFAELPQAEALAAANKRIGNLLRRADEDGAEAPAIDEQLLEDGAETALFRAYGQARDAVMPLFAEPDYTAALSRLAELREPVDAYFDQVMVMTDDAALRRNRLGLLSAIRALFLNVADISVLTRA